MNRWLQSLWAVLLALASSGALAQGRTVAIGGALQDGTAEVWQRLVQLVADEREPAGACYSIITIASGDPDASAAAVAANLARHGGRGVHLRVGPRIAGSDVMDPRWPAQVRQCRGVYMTGGAQARLLDALMPAGRATPLLDAMRAVWRAGGVVAGSSAGAAVMSEVVFRDAPDPLAVMKGRLQPCREWGYGFGFAPRGVVVDQHAVRRGRLARLLPLMVAQGQPLGVAVEENSAALFERTAEGDQLTVLGARGVLVADLSGSLDATAAPLQLQGATLHWLESGDRFDLGTRRVTPSAAKQAGTPLQPLSAQHDGYLTGPWFYADMLGEAMVVAAMTRLVDGDQRQLFGLAFAAQPAHDDPAPDIGFEWRWWLDDASRGWLLKNPERYTISGVRFDIVPVRLQRPLYQPLPKPVPAPVLAPMPQPKQASPSRATPP